MILLPLLVLALGGYGVYTLVHRRAQPVASGVDAAAVPIAHQPFWPTSLEGKLGLGAFAVSFLPFLLVNVVQVPYLGAAFLVIALVLLPVARFVRHDRATSVLLGIVFCALNLLLGLLFLAGELLIGHS